MTKSTKNIYANPTYMIGFLLYFIGVAILFFVSDRPLWLTIGGIVLIIIAAALFGVVIRSYAQQRHNDK